MAFLMVLQQDIQCMVPKQQRQSEEHATVGYNRFACRQIYCSHVQIVLCQDITQIQISILYYVYYRYFRIYFMIQKQISNIAILKLNTILCRQHHPINTIYLFLFLLTAPVILRAGQSREKLPTSENSYLSIYLRCAAGSLRRGARRDVS